MRENEYDINDNIRAGVALSMIPDIGAGKTNKLFKAFPSPMKIFSVSWDVLARVEGVGVASAKSIYNFNGWDSVDNTIKKAFEQGLKLLTPNDQYYPDLLRHIYDPPAVIWVKGNREALNKNFVAVVGTRNPTAGGRDVTKRITKSLLDYFDIGIVSGLAYGVDTVAHRTAIEKGECTVAVLGSGLDNIYPRINRNLANNIIKTGGALISEYPPGTKPESHHFPVRNRLVSGMSHGIVITETRPSGGSKITLNAALDQGREVFIVPHDIRNENGRGCNEFIRNGWGKLICEIKDIADELPEYLQKKSDKKITEPGKSRKKHKNDQETIRKGNREIKKEADIITLLRGKTVDIDEISQKMAISGNELLQLLLELEISGRIVQKPGKRFTAREW